MPWSHNEAMQGWEAAEEREASARCDAERWQELATDTAGCAQVLLDLMTPALREAAVPEVKDAIAFLEEAIAKVRAREARPKRR